MRFTRMTMGTALLAAGSLLASVQPASARHILIYRGGYGYGYAMPYRVPGYGIVGYGVGPTVGGYSMPYRVPGYGAYGSSFGYGGYGYGYGSGPGLGYGAGIGGYGAGYGYQQPYSATITPGYSGGVVQQPGYGTAPGYSGGVVQQPAYGSNPRYTDAVPGEGPASGSSQSLYPPSSAPGTPAQADSPPAREPAQPEDSRTIARLRVVVPNADAQLWVNGVQTRQNGIEREFISPELKPGKSYAYQLRARWRNADGQATEQTRTVAIQAGGRQMVDFNKDEEPAVATPQAPARTEARTPAADSPPPPAREEARPPAAAPDDSPAPEAAPSSPAPAQPERNTLPPTRRFTVPPPTPEGP